MNINLTLFGQTLGFALFVAFCWRYVWPPLLAALQKRREDIAEGLAAAERGQQEEALAQERAQETLREARRQAAEIVDNAQKRGNELVEEAKDSARSEAERIRQTAHVEIEQETTRAREQLRARVASIAVAGAERILGREVDAEAHNRSLDDLVSRL